MTHADWLPGRPIRFAYRQASFWREHFLADLKINKQESVFGKISNRKLFLKLNSHLTTHDSHRKYSLLYFFFSFNLSNISTVSLDYSLNVLDAPSRTSEGSVKEQDTGTLSSGTSQQIQVTG